MLTELDGLELLHSLHVLVVGGYERARKWTWRRRGMKGREIQDRYDGERFYEGT